MKVCNNLQLLTRFEDNDPRTDLLPEAAGCFVPSLFEIGPVGLEKKIFKFR